MATKKPPVGGAFNISSEYLGNSKMIHKLQVYSNCKLLMPVYKTSPAKESSG